MSSRRHKSHKSIKNKSRRFNKKGGNIYAMVGRTAIRTGSSFGSFGAKTAFPLVLMYVAPTLTPKTRKETVGYFNKFVNAINGFIQKNVTAAGTKKLIDTITHPEVVVKGVIKSIDDKRVQYSDPAQREKLIASAKAKASSVAESAKSAANKVAQTEQYKNVSKVVSDATKNVTDSEQFKSASAAANKAVQSKEFQAASSAAANAASKAATVATNAYNNKYSAPAPAATAPTGGRSKKTIKRKNKKTNKTKKYNKK